MKSIINLHNRIFTIFQNILEPVFLLFLRLWVAWVFFKAGLIKAQSWSSTMYLFSQEYKVPVLPPELAAYLATGVELIIPAFLLMGIFTRLSASILFVFNIIAVVSYPILTKAGFSLFSLGAMDHQIWGLMLASIMLFGAGRVSLDYLLRVK